MVDWTVERARTGVIQLAYTVADIHAAMPLFSARLGIGPWFLFEHFRFNCLAYRGRPSDIDISLCLGFSGDTMYELIQQHDDGPSPYGETVARRGHGFHHWGVAAMPDRYDGLLAGYLAQGYGLALEGEVAIGARAAYVDAQPDLPGFIEIIEVTPPVDALFSMIHRASIGWDGSDPVRNLEALI